METFTANDNSDKTANIEVPTNVSELTNDAGYLTADSLADMTDQMNAMQQALDSTQQMVGDIVENSFVCGLSKMKDVDGNEYNTVKIGNQCWMKENLRTTHFPDGSEIPFYASGVKYMPARYNPKDSAGLVLTHGYLYNWHALMNGTATSSANPSGVQGICPDGWHVPGDAEWTQLIDYVGSQSQYKCSGNNENIAKALASTTGWELSSGICTVGNDPSANNATGSSALPAGEYSGLGAYTSLGHTAFFWSTTESVGNKGYMYYLRYYESQVIKATVYSKQDAYSVRCLHD